MRRSQHNPMVDIVQYQLDASIHLADAVFSGTEKIDRAVLDVTHQAVDGQLKFARAVADMRDPGKMVDLQVSIAARPEKAMHCQQQIMAALVEMQAEFGKSIRNYMERMSNATASQADEATQQMTQQMPQQMNTGLAQAQDAMNNPFTGMMSVWEQAFREATRLANQNMMAARSNVESAAHAAGEAMARSMEAGTGGANGHAHGSHSSHGAHKGRGGRRK